MKTFYIRITETLELSVPIQASSATDALELARQRWRNGDYVLDAGNFTEVSFAELSKEAYEQEH